MRKYIAYYRVSTKRQGDSGLGLDAQRQDAAEFVRSRGAEILDEFIEVESGADDDRPQLKAALAAAELYRVPLLIAKLDRLSRSAAFLMRLQESGVQFVCADMPDVCDMTIGVMALVARQEREAISKRTKAALRQAKERGVKLGGHRANSKPPSIEDREKSARVLGNAARRRAENYRQPLIDAVRAGANNPSEIAAHFRTTEVPTVAGKVGTWQAIQVNRLLRALDITIRDIIKEHT